MTDFLKVGIAMPTAKGRGTASLPQAFAALACAPMKEAAHRGGLTALQRLKQLTRLPMLR